MLRSTYKPADVPKLAAGWTEHKAPTGHLYYYNSATKQSTYTRPIASEPPSEAPLALGDGADHVSISGPPDVSNPRSHGHESIDRHHHGQRRSYVQDRPKLKHIIPQCEPWLLVKTKLGRRFVYNPEQNVSLWKFPPEVMRCVIEYDRLEREKKQLPNREQESNVQPAGKQGHDGAEAGVKSAESVDGTPDSEDGETDYEEADSTDDEDGAPKRAKMENLPQDAPVEFNEDDIAYQLAAMGQEYGLDPGEYGADEDDKWEEGAEGLALTAEDSNALFRDMLDDFHADPYTTWEKLVEGSGIVEDSRYTCLSNMKRRREVWEEWSRERIGEIKQRREQEEKKDPRIPYLTFLHERATPKLYWPEFRRKYKKEPEMRNTKLADKEREKLYREYITRLQLPESTLKSDLATLLKAQPLHQFNQSTSLDALPSAVLTDIRYASLRARVRDPLIEAYISSLPPRPEMLDLTIEEEADQAKRSSEREARERALRMRDETVQAEKRRQRGMLASTRNMLRDGEEEIHRAMQVSKQGLLGHLQADS